MMDGQTPMGNMAGGITSVAGRLMTGWLSGAAGPLSVEFYEGAALLGATVAEAGEDGKLAFEFMLPRILFDGAGHEISARIGEEILALEGCAQVLGALLPVSPPVGWLEKVSEDGWVRGWAWYPDRPDARLEVELLVDGHVAGTAMAGLYRADVAKAGHGDGCYGFSWPLPYSVLALARDVTISVRDKSSGTELPKPIVFSQKIVADAFSKIRELENDVKLLNATIAALEQRAMQDDRASTELFKTVGDFFAGLAAASAAGTPLSELRSVKSAVAEVTAGLVPFAYPACSAPEITVFVEAAGTLEVSYAALRAVFETMGDAKCEVFLLDDGTCDEAPLLPMVVQNMRYARLPGTRRAGRSNDAMRLAGASAVMFVGPGCILASGWAEAMSVFEGRPHLAVLAGRVRDAQGELISAGVELQNNEALPRGRWSEVRGAVDAASPDMFALRRNTWQQLKGFDEGYAGLGPALVAFCLSARGAGHAVGYEPGFGGVRKEGWAERLDLEAQSADAVRLREVIGSFREAAE